MAPVEPTFSMEKFVLTIDNFLTAAECQIYVRYFDDMHEAKMSANRYQGHGLHNNEVADTQMSMHSEDVVCLKGTRELATRFQNRFWEIAYPHYLSEVGILKHYPPHSSNFLKMQKTKPAEGYHVFHAEDMSIGDQGRLLTWICYLNDNFEGGETELLYQSMRVKPKKGRLILFPAGFTHTHRGNPPLDGEKYIITGWVET